MYWCSTSSANSLKLPRNWKFYEVLEFGSFHPKNQSFHMTLCGAPQKETSLIINIVSTTFWVDKTGEAYLETTINWQWATAASTKSAESSAKPEDKQRECGSASNLWTSTSSTEICLIALDLFVYYNNIIILFKKLIQNFKIICSV